jgi:hypothetical protein
LRERQLSKDIGFRLVKQPIVCGKRLMIAGVMRCLVVRMARPSSWMVFKNS